MCKYFWQFFRGDSTKFHRNGLEAAQMLRLLLTSPLAPFSCLSLLLQGRFLQLENGNSCSRNDTWKSTVSNTKGQFIKQCVEGAITPRLSCFSVVFFCSFLLVVPFWIFQNIMHREGRPFSSYRRSAFLLGIVCCAWQRFTISTH